MLAPAIRKAVIPVAGHGTRLLPATKSQPKEMLPVGRKPTVQYVVEEMEQAGITQILFITGRAKTQIENHFDRDPELEHRLAQTGAYELQEELKYCDSGIKFFYTRQSSPTGVADAIRQAEDFVGEEPFVVGFGDTIIRSEGRHSLLQRMIQSHVATGASCTVAVEEVPPEEIHRYGVVKPKQERPGDGGESFAVESLIEKPDRDAAPSNLAIAPRYIFDRSIFGAIELTLPGRGGELWLTDSMVVLIKQGHQVRAVQLGEGERRYDIGNFETYFKAFIDLAVADEKYGYMIRQYLLWKSEQF